MEKSTISMAIFNSYVTNYQMDRWYINQQEIVSCGWCPTIGIPVNPCEYVLVTTIGIFFGSRSLLGCPFRS